MPKNNKKRKQHPNRNRPGQPHVNRQGSVGEVEVSPERIEIIDMTSEPTHANLNDAVMGELANVLRGLKLDANDAKTGVVLMPEAPSYIRDDDDQPINGGNGECELFDKQKMYSLADFVETEGEPDDSTMKLIELMQGQDVYGPPVFCPDTDRYTGRMLCYLHQKEMRTNVAALRTASVQTELTPQFELYAPLSADDSKLVFILRNVREMDTSQEGPIKIIRGYNFQILVKIMDEVETDKGTLPKRLGYLLHVWPVKPQIGWTITVTADLRLMSQKSGCPHLMRKITHVFNESSSDWGYSNFITFENLLDESRGFHREEFVILEVTMKIEEPDFATYIMDFRRDVKEYISKSKAAKNAGDLAAAIRHNEDGMRYCKDKDNLSRAALEVQKKELLKILKADNTFGEDVDEPSPVQTVKNSKTSKAKTTVTTEENEGVLDNKVETVDKVPMKKETCESSTSTSEASSIASKSSFDEEPSSTSTTSSDHPKLMDDNIVKVTRPTVNGTYQPTKTETLGGFTGKLEGSLLKKLILDHIPPYAWADNDEFVERVIDSCCIASGIAVPCSDRARQICVMNFLQYMNEYKSIQNSRTDREANHINATDMLNRGCAVEIKDAALVSDKVETEAGTTNNVGGVTTLATATDDVPSTNEATVPASEGESIPVSEGKTNPPSKSDSDSDTKKETVTNSDEEKTTSIQNDENVDEDLLLTELSKLFEQGRQQLRAEMVEIDIDLLEGKLLNFWNCITNYSLERTIALPSPDKIETRYQYRFDCPYCDEAAANRLAASRDTQTDMSFYNMPMDKQPRTEKELVQERVLQNFNYVPCDATVKTIMNLKDYFEPPKLSEEKKLIAVECTKKVTVESTTISKVEGVSHPRPIAKAVHKSKTTSSPPQTEDSEKNRSCPNGQLEDDKKKEGVVKSENVVAKNDANSSNQSTAPNDIDKNKDGEIKITYRKSFKSIPPELLEVLPAGYVAPAIPEFNFEAHGGPTADQALTALGTVALNLVNTRRAASTVEQIMESMLKSAAACNWNDTITKLWGFADSTYPKRLNKPRFPKSEKVKLPFENNDFETLYGNLLDGNNRDALAMSLLVERLELYKGYLDDYICIEKTDYEQLKKALPMIVNKLKNEKKRIYELTNQRDASDGRLKKAEVTVEAELVAQSKMVTVEKDKNKRLVAELDEKNKTIKNLTQKVSNEEKKQQAQEKKDKDELAEKLKQSQRDFHNSNRKHNEEVLKLKTEMATLEDKNIMLQTQCASFKSNADEKERERTRKAQATAELERQATKVKEELKNEKMTVAKMEEEIKAQRHRAMLMEVQYLELKLESGITVLERARVDAIKKVSEVEEACQHKGRPNAEIKSLYEAREEWTKIKNNIDGLISTTRKEHQKHIQLIRNGKQLSELPRLEIPPPPPPAKMIKIPPAPVEMPKPVPGVIGQKSNGATAYRAEPVKQHVQQVKKIPQERIHHPGPPPGIPYPQHMHNHVPEPISKTANVQQLYNSDILVPSQVRQTARNTPIGQKPQSYLPHATQYATSASGYATQHTQLPTTAQASPSPPHLAPIGTKPNGTTVTNTASHELSSSPWSWSKSIEEDGSIFQPTKSKSPATQNLNGNYSGSTFLSNLNGASLWDNQDEVWGAPLTKLTNNDATNASKNYFEGYNSGQSSSQQSSSRPSSTQQSGLMQNAFQSALPQSLLQSSMPSLMSRSQSVLAQGNVQNAHSHTYDAQRLTEFFQSQQLKDQAELQARLQAQTAQDAQAQILQAAKAAQLLNDAQQVATNSFLNQSLWHKNSESDYIDHLNTQAELISPKLGVQVTGQTLLAFCKSQGVPEFTMHANGELFEPFKAWYMQMVKTARHDHSSLATSNHQSSLPLDRFEANSFTNFRRSNDLSNQMSDSIQNQVNTLVGNTMHDQMNGLMSNSIHQANDLMNSTINNSTNTALDSLFSTSMTNSFVNDRPVSNQYTNSTGNSVNDFINNSELPSTSGAFSYPQW